MRMNKALLRVAFVGILVFASVPMMCASMLGDNIETEVVAVTISQEGQSTIRIIGAQDKVLEIYKVTGVSVDRIRIDSNDKRIELNLPKGCYILKVGKVVRKISIK
ncbi:MAG: secretion protein [Prevotella sp.]|nr:secretion protein [Candidatus Equicola faecalis]